MRAPKAILYTRKGCHLCDQAQALLARHGISTQIVDIDTDPELQQLYNESVPVVELDGRVRFRGRVDPRLLRRLVERR